MSFLIRKYPTLGNQILCKLCTALTKNYLTLCTSGGEKKCMIILTYATMLLKRFKYLKR